MTNTLHTRLTFFGFAVELDDAAAVAVLAAASLAAPAVMRTWLNTTFEPVKVAVMAVLADKPASEPMMVAVQAASVVLVTMHFSMTVRYAKSGIVTEE